MSPLTSIPSLDNTEISRIQVQKCKYWLRQSPVVAANKEIVSYLW